MRIPRWICWAVEWLAPLVDKTPQERYLDVVRRERDLRGRVLGATSVAAAIAREWTLSNAVRAQIDHGVYLPSSVWTLRHVLRNTHPYDALPDPPVVALSSRFDSAYCAALARVVYRARRAVDNDYPDLLEEIARDDPRAAYQVAVCCVGLMLTATGDEFDEPIEQVFRFAETGAPVDAQWLSQATAPASHLIDEAYRSTRVRVLYYLLLATNPRRCAAMLGRLAVEHQQIEAERIARETRHATLHGVPPVLKRNGDGTYTTIEPTSGKR